MFGYIFFNEMIFVKFSYKAIKKGKNIHVNQP